MRNELRRKIIRKNIATVLAFMLMISFSTAAFAAGGFTDISQDAWYADAAAYVQENKLMDGITADEFAPNTPANRITLTVALYRAEGSPTVSAPVAFPDVENGTEDSDAVSWATANGIVGGYDNGLFGTNDPVTREQIATFFWRYAGQPEANSNAEVFADQSGISDWAQTAVAWARSNSVMNGKPNNLYDPKGIATRAEVAALLMNYLSRQNPEQPKSQTVSSGKTLVVYFSMPETTDPNNMTQDEANSVVVVDGEVLGNTQYVAYIIQENTGADIFRIESKTPYPTDHTTLVDLAREEQNNNARPELAANVENIEQYDVIFLGYPTWFSDMPMVLYSFLESVDLSGKTIIPFNTHGGSGFSNTINTIVALQPNATVEKSGFTVSRNIVQSAENDVIAWLREMGIIE